MFYVIRGRRRRPHERMRDAVQSAIRLGLSAESAPDVTVRVLSALRVAVGAGCDTTTVRVGVAVLELHLVTIPDHLKRDPQ